MTKEELRKVYIQKRSALSDSECLELNVALCKVFFKSVDLSKIKVLHSFLPIQKNNEPDTTRIVKEIIARYRDIRIAIPRVNNKTQLLESIFLDDSTVLKNSAWGIPEPEAGVTVESGKIEMVLVPMLVFDRRGHRVGYGKGFYDKFLSTTSPNCKRVGLCLFDPVDRIEDIKDFDEPLDQCVTPAGTYTF